MLRVLFVMMYFYGTYLILPYVARVVSNDVNPNDAENTSFSTVYP